MPVDGNNFPQGAFDFAEQLNQQQPVLLTGLFLPSVDYTDISMYYIGGLAGPLYPLTLDEEPGIMLAAKKRFEELCLKHHIEYRIHDDIQGSIIDGIKKESRYSDLLILSNELFYKNLGERTQKEYLNDTMHAAECPIIVVPESFSFPQSIVMAYDGTEESVYAIKQFSYLFPELTGLKTLVVYASDSGDEIPDMPYVEEFAARHFSNLTFFKLEADAGKYFSTWLADHGNTLLVSGSHSRSALSEMLSKSFLEAVISEHRIPIFNAHK